MMNIKILQINGKEYVVGPPTNIIGNNNDLLQWLDENHYYHRIDGPARIWEGHRDEWYIHGHDITDEVEKWMTIHKIKYPFDEDTQTLFKLTFA